MDTTHLCDTSLPASIADNSRASPISLHIISKRSNLIGNDLMCSINNCENKNYKTRITNKQTHYTPYTKSIFFASKLHTTLISMPPYSAASKKFPINSIGFSISLCILFKAESHVRAVTTT